MYFVFLLQCLRIIKVVFLRLINIYLLFWEPITNLSSEITSIKLNKCYLSTGLFITYKMNAAVVHGFPVV